METPSVVKYSSFCVRWREARTAAHQESAAPLVPLTRLAFSCLFLTSEILFGIAVCSPKQNEKKPYKSSLEEVGLSRKSESAEEVLAE